jgi:hypothetical protein
MSVPSVSQGSEPRPGYLKSTKSLPRPDATDSPFSRPQRANTTHNGTNPEVVVVQDSSSDSQLKRSDAFESAPTEDEVEIPRASVDMDMIPIELVSMTDKLVGQARLF